RGAVVWRTEGRRLNQAGASVQDAGDGMDSRHLERFPRAELGEDAGQPAGEHRLSGPRRPGEQEVVAPGRGELERTPRAFLTSDPGEVRFRDLASHALSRNVRGWTALPAQVGDRLDEMPDRDRLDAGERRLGRRRSRAEDLFEPEPLRTLRH